MCKTAYDTIRQHSSKPAFICFNGTANNPVTFADAYDVAVYDYYPCDHGQPEFSDFNTFQTRMDLISTMAAQAGKPWWPVLQGIGQVSVITWDFRLPTFNESRFMTYYGGRQKCPGRPELVSSFLQDDHRLSRRSLSLYRSAVAHRCFPGGVQ